MRLFFYFLFVAFFTCLNANAQQNGTLTVEVTNIKDLVGNIRVVIFTSKDELNDSIGKMKGTSHIPSKRKGQIPADNENVRISFRLPIGMIYSIAVFHDKNCNRMLDRKPTNFLGKKLFGYDYVPTEPYGNSRKGEDWESTKIKFDETEAGSLVTIKLRTDKWGVRFLKKH